MVIPFDFTVGLLVVTDAELYFGLELREEFSEKFVVHLGSTVRLNHFGEAVVGKNVRVE
jgi:hypothetical protein